MPTGLGTATTGNNGSSSSGQPGDVSGDIGNGGSSSSGGTVVIAGGDAPSTYGYDIISLYGGAGSAYVAMNNSNMNCNSSVAVFNRNNAFAAINTSAANFSNCCAYAAHQGFNANHTSKLAGYMCVASICAWNYRSVAASSLYANLCASVFPVVYGVYASNNSSFISVEHQTMTAFWDSLSTIVPTHYRSSQNSFVTNSNLALSSKISAGLSGPVLSGQQVGFVWSQLWRNPTTGSGFPVISDIGLNNFTPFTTITTGASYRYVPFNHCLDYVNAVGPNGMANDQGNISLRDTFTLLSQGRNCYVSVKPPSGMFKPEDGSGSTGAGVYNGSYSVYDVLPTLV